MNHLLKKRLALAAATLLALILCFSGASGVTVCLDPGHGGTDPGAVGDYYQEKAANLDVSFAAKDYLELVSGVVVGMTRTTDVTVSLADRCDFANSGGYDRFMSQHHNAFNETVQGTETYCHSDSLGGPSQDLRDEVHPEIIWAFGYNDRGTKTADFYVLRLTNMPSILGEGSFIDYKNGFDESWRFATDWEDHAGREGYAYCKGFCDHLGLPAPPYGGIYPDTTIVDDDNADFVGTWAISTWGENYDGEKHYKSPGDGSASATWTAPVPENARCHVHFYVNYGAYADSAEYIIEHSGGTDTVCASQYNVTTGWHHLGQWDFSSVASVTVTDTIRGQGTYVVADAIMFINISDHTPPQTVEDVVAVTSSSDIHLSWSSVTQDTSGNPETLSHYVIYRSTDPETIPGDSIAGTTDTTYLDAGAAGATGTDYFYVVRAADDSGNESKNSEQVGEYDIHLLTAP